MSKTFKGLVKKWRPNYKTVSYKKLSEDKKLFKAHRQIVHSLQDLFKKIFRDTKPAELATCIEALFRKWRDVYTCNKAEIARRDGRYDPYTQRLWSDQKDMESIINVMSSTRKKTVLHKLVENIKKNAGDADSMLRMLILVLKAPGMVNPELKDLDEDSALGLITHMREEYEMENDGYSSKSTKVGERDTRLVVYDFIESIGWCKSATPANLARFGESCIDFAKEIFTRLDIMKEARAAAKSGSFKNFRAVVQRTNNRLCGVVSFNVVVDFVSLSNDHPRTALEKALERPIKDRNRKKIWQWLVKHGAHPSNVKDDTHRSEANKVREELKKTQSQLLSKSSSKLPGSSVVKTPAAALAEKKSEAATDHDDTDSPTSSERRPSLFTKVGDAVDMTTDDPQWEKAHTIEKSSTMNSSYIAPTQPTFREDEKAKPSATVSATKEAEKSDDDDVDDDDDDDDDDDLALPEDDHVIASPSRTPPTQKVAVSAKALSSTPSSTSTTPSSSRGEPEVPKIISNEENRTTPKRSPEEPTSKTDISRSSETLALSSDDEDEDEFSMRGFTQEKPSRGCCGMGGGGEDDCSVQ